MLKERFNFFSPGEKMTNSKYIFDSWFDELFDELSWDFVCKEQDNYDKAVDLAKSFLSQSEEEYQFMMKWILQPPKKPFCDFIFSLCIKNESRTNINP